MVLQVIGYHLKTGKTFKMIGLHFLWDPPLRPSIKGTTHCEGNFAMLSLRALGFWCTVHSCAELLIVCMPMVPPIFGGQTVFYEG